MEFIVIVTVLALFQYIFFAVQVGQARGKYGVKAPAVAGNEHFERVYRVQMNTLEQLVMFLPALWMATRYLPPAWVSAIGAVYLVGRFIYANSYVKDPSKRGLGFMLSFAPSFVLLVIALGGAIWTTVV